MLEKISFGIDIATALSVIAASTSWMITQRVERKRKREFELADGARSSAAAVVDEQISLLSEQFRRVIATTHQVLPNTGGDTSIQNLATNIRATEFTRVINSDALGKCSDAAWEFVELASSTRYVIIPTLEALGHQEETIKDFNESLSRMLNSSNDLNAKGRPLVNDLWRLFELLLIDPVLTELELAYLEKRGRLDGLIAKRTEDEDSLEAISNLEEEVSGLEMRVSDARTNLLITYYNRDDALEALSAVDSILFDRAYIEWTQNFMSAELQQAVQNGAALEVDQVLIDAARQGFICTMASAAKRANNLAMALTDYVYIPTSENQITCKKLLILLSALSCKIKQGDKSKSIDELNEMFQSPSYFGLGESIR
jgi:hypothetical protein